MNIENLSVFYENQSKSVGNKVTSPSLHRKYNEVVRTVLNNKSYGSNVLDVGCQAGGLSVILASLGYICTSLDVSNRYLGYVDLNARRFKVKDKIKIVQGFAEDIDSKFETEYFDVVILSSILEHTENYQEIFDKAKTITKIGGIIIVNVPIGRAFYSEEHLVIFDEKKVKEVFEGCEFKKIYFKKTIHERGWYNIVWRNVYE